MSILVGIAGISYSGFLYSNPNFQKKEAEVTNIGTISNGKKPESASTVAEDDKKSIDGPQVDPPDRNSVVLGLNSKRQGLGSAVPYKERY